LNQAIFSTTVIPTVGRPELARAVESVLAQSAPRAFEVVVVNDSGSPLPQVKWQSDPRVIVLETDRVERCVARNTGAGTARGGFFHFLDDDDWLLPDGLAALHEAAAAGQQGFVYGATRLVDRAGERLVDLEHGLSGNVAAQLMCGEWVPLQSSLIDRSLFFELGGFHAWQAGSEDIDFVRRAAVACDFGYVPVPVSVVVMGAAGSTTDHAHQRERSRRGRELILDQPETFRRMRRSAAGPQWRGGVARIYLTSVVWNLSRLRLLAGGKRLAYGLAALANGGGYLFAGAFWRAVLRPYSSVTFGRAQVRLPGAGG
jgi:glycosyltransferase involved in cell wall biosynthesis